MAIRAGRVGVRADQVDAYGRITKVSAGFYEGVLAESLAKITTGDTIVNFSKTSAGRKFINSIKGNTIVSDDELVSFNGTGIKTTGKNLNPWTGVDYMASTSRTVFLKKGDYVFSTDNGNNFEGSTQVYICLVDSNGNNITRGGITSGYLSLNDSGTFYYGGYGRNNIPFTLNLDAFVSFGFNNQRPTNINEIQLEFGSTPSDYEPYTSSTTNLPVSTYFPTGMKSAGTVYDELTPSKAITRIGMVDLGSLKWQLERENHNVFLAGPQSYIKPPINNDTVANIKCALYSTNTSINVYNYNVDKAVGLSDGGALRIVDTSFSDANTFKQSLSGVYLYYELATETEVDVNLDLSYKTYEGGTEQLLSVTDTSPLRADITSYTTGATQNDVEKLLGSIAQVETSPATGNHAVGDYIMYNYQLYKVTASITTGASLVVGTNITATTVMDEFKTL